MNYWDNPNTYRKTVWAARLSNGEVVYQEDHNGEPQPIAWLRLKERVERGEVQIEDLGVKFMDNEVWLGPSEGYYFANGVIGFLYGDSFNLRKIGKIENGKLKVKSYKCPELILVEEEEKEPEGENLILNLCINPA